MPPKTGTFSILSLSFSFSLPLSLLFTDAHSCSRADGQLLTRTFFSRRGDLVCEYNQPSIVTAIYNYAWFIRLDIWMCFTALFFVPQNTWCFKTLLYYLARMDCAWKLLSSTLHLTVRWPMIEIGHLVWFLKYLIFLAMMVVLEPHPQPHAGTIDVAYLLINIALTLVNEIYLGAFVRYPFPLPGRLRRSWMTRDEVLNRVVVVVVYCCWLCRRHSTHMLPPQSIFIHLAHRQCVLYLLEHIDLRLCTGFKLVLVVLDPTSVRYVFSLVLSPSLSLSLVQVLMKFPCSIVMGLTPGELCDCTLQNEIYLSVAEYTCGTRTNVDCYFAVLLTWLAAALVSFVLIYFCWAVVMLAIGVLRGIIIGVGSVQSWQDVTWALVRLQDTGMNVITAARPFRGNSKPDGMQDFLEGSSAMDPEAIRRTMRTISEQADKSIWSWFIESLYEDHLITKEEMKMLSSDAAFPPTNDEAQRRIVHFMWSLDHMNNIESGQSFYRQCHRVRTMPSWTVIVPIYNESIVYSADELRTRRRPDRYERERERARERERERERERDDHLQCVPVHTSMINKCTHE